MPPNACHDGQTPLANRLGRWPPRSLRYAPKMRRQAWIYTGALLGIVCANAHEEIYRWTDANGQVHYADRPPADQSHTVTDIHPAPATTLQPSTDEASEHSENPGNAATESPQATPDASALAEQCDRANERLAFYQRTPAVRVLYKNKSGETVRMTPQERKARMSRYRELAAESCNQR